MKCMQPRPPYSVELVTTVNSSGKAIAIISWLRAVAGLHSVHSTSGQLWAAVFRFPFFLFFFFNEKKRVCMSYTGAAPTEVNAQN